MPILKFQDFIKDLKKPSPVYLFAGEESYLISVCLEAAEKLLKADNLNKEIFYAGETSAQAILNAVQTLPFLSEKRVVVVKDVQKIKAADAEVLTEYIENPFDSSSLILLYNSNYKKETIAKRKALINKSISVKNCIAVDCRKQYDNEVRDFIKTEFAKRNKSVSYDVISRMIDENGTDLLNISNEIEKLSLFTGDRKSVTEEDAEKISGHTKEANIYALASEVEAKNLKKAMFILERLLADGEDAIMILTTLTSTVRKMVYAKSMMEEEGMSVSDTAAALRIHSFFARPYFANLNKHTLKSLKKSLKVILKADLSIKTGASDSVSALERILLSVCR